MTRLRIPVLLTALVATSLAAAHSGLASPRQNPAPAPTKLFAPKYMETIRVRNADPGVIAGSLKGNGLPEGVVRVATDPTDRHALRVIGTADGIASVRQLVGLMDVAPKRVLMHYRISRILFSADGHQRARVVTQAKSVTAQNVPAGVTTKDAISGDTVQLSLTPRLADAKGNRITVAVQFGIRAASGKSVGTSRTLWIPYGQPLRRVIGVTESTEKPVLNTIARGEVPASWHQGFVAYFVETQASPATTDHP